jgi:hypothetical protein
MQAGWSGELGVADFIFTSDMEASIELNSQAKPRKRGFGQSGQTATGALAIVGASGRLTGSFSTT